MIDSTIYTNGRGEVTAQNINLAMHGIVDATEEGLAEVEKKIGESGSASNGPLTVWINEIFGFAASDEMKAKNAEAYNAIVSKEAVSLMGRLEKAEDDITICGSCNLDYWAFINEEGGAEVALSLIVEGDYMNCLLFYDGTLEVLSE